MVKIFHKLEESILSLLLVLMTLLVFGEVVARFVFNHGIMWAQELTLIINSWMVLLSASYCIREKAHIGVDFVVRLFRPKMARIVLVISLLACLMYSGIFLYAATYYVWEDYQIGIELDDLPIQTWIPATSIVVGFGLVMVRFLAALYRVIIHDDINALQHVGEVEESMELSHTIKDKKI